LYSKQSADTQTSIVGTKEPQGFMIYAVSTLYVKIDINSLLSFNAKFLN